MGEAEGWEVERPVVAGRYPYQKSAAMQIRIPFVDVTQVYPYENCAAEEVSTPNNRHRLLELLDG